MLELFLGFFLLGSLSLAFREYSDQDSATVEPQSDFTRDEFDQSVYEPVAAIAAAADAAEKELQLRTEHTARTDDFHKVFQNLSADSGAELDC